MSSKLDKSNPQSGIPLAPIPPTSALAPTSALIARTTKIPLVSPLSLPHPPPMQHKRHQNMIELQESNKLKVNGNKILDCKTTIVDKNNTIMQLNRDIKRVKKELRTSKNIENVNYEVLNIKRNLLVVNNLFSNDFNREVDSLKFRGPINNTLELSMIRDKFVKSINALNKSLIDKITNTFRPVDQLKGGNKTKRNRNKKNKTRRIKH
jgi:hypothetical protein